MSDVSHLLPASAAECWPDAARRAAFEAWLTRVQGPQKLNPASLRMASADASFRRYLRLDTTDGATRIVMDAPPAHEDCTPFVHVAEWLLRRRLCALPLALCCALMAIMSLAAAYEIIEWQYAVIEGGNAGIEFLGSQGDVWDAQKDMLADTLGALTALGLFLLARPDRRWPSPSATAATP